MLLDTRNKNMYRLGLIISTIFEKKKWALPVIRGTEPPQMIMTYTPTDAL
jgi:hypothetical protein